MSDSQHTKIQTWLGATALGLALLAFFGVAHFTDLFSAGRSPAGENLANGTSTSAQLPVEPLSTSTPSPSPIAGLNSSPTPTATPVNTPSSMPPPGSNTDGEISAGEPTPPAPSQLGIQLVSAALTPTDSRYSPDKAGIRAIVVFNIANISDRELRIAWFKSRSDSSFDLSNGTHFSYPSEYQGLRNCGMRTGPDHCTDDELILLSPRETVRASIQFETDVPSARRDKLLKVRQGSFSTQIAVQPGGTQRAYLKSLSLTNVPLSGEDE